MISAVSERSQITSELGIPRNLCEDLALKILYLQGELSLLELAHQLGLRLGIVEELFERLRREVFCEVKGMAGNVRRIAITSQGRDRALELLSQSQYAGPAPVSLKDYTARVRAQSVKTADVRRADLLRAFEHLVLSIDTLGQLGTAVASGRTIFLYGPTGTGKTAIAEALRNIYHDAVWIPYAIEVDGQIVSVYDSNAHEPAPGHASADEDRRWVRCRRPCIVAGGELTLGMLDLQFNPDAKFYTAPLQMKANNGVLIIDDFGRQRVTPAELLNRWILPLDRGIDFLGLAGGKKFEIAFDLFVAFATNVEPATLADEAFLRRIHTKVKVGFVTRDQFHAIFRRVCTQFEIAYDAEVVDYLIAKLAQLNQPLRACYPRDVVQQIAWTARYEGSKARLDRMAVDRACANYFLAA